MQSTGIAHGFLKGSELISSPREALTIREGDRDGQSQGRHRRVPPRCWRENWKAKARMGPYKAITQVRAIRALISHAPQDVGSRYRENWNRLRALSAVMAPRDHQVMLSEDGRIVTIDVEQVGSGRDLPSL
eukprot:jgi/Psemu1/30525/gm1.30525_g